MVAVRDKVPDGLHFSGSKRQTFMHYEVTVVRWTKLSSSPRYINR